MDPVFRSTHELTNSKKPNNVPLWHFMDKTRYNNTNWSTQNKTQLFLLKIISTYI